jgi:uncharacterized protein YbaP (TraB family)
MITPTGFAANLALGLLCGSSALAQANSDNTNSTPPVAPIPIDSQANLVEELVVNGRLPGPAWWKVTDADTVVYVMGIPAFYPKRQTFDPAVLRRRLDGANVLILGQKADLNMMAFLGVMVGGAKKFKSARPMRETLPPDLRVRLEARLAADKEPLNAVDGEKPALAGFRIANGSNSEGAIDIGEPMDHIRNLAQSKALAKPPRIRKLRDLNLIEAVKSLANAPQPLQELCLDAGLRQAESGDGGIKATAQRWAQGQVREVVSANRGFQRCLASAPLIARELDRGRDEAVAAVVDALQAPGKAVAVVELRSLLAQDGVLDQLRAKGFNVLTPE